LDPKSILLAGLILLRAAASEHGRAADHTGFLDAVATEMEAPFCTQLFPHIQAKSKLLHARHAYDATATREADLVSQLEELSCGKRRALLDKFLPLLDILATRVRVVRRLRELLTTKFPPGTFPVKVSFSLLLCSSGLSQHKLTRLSHNNI
jgi:hypothetical protein